MPQVAPTAPHAVAKDRRSSSAAVSAAGLNVLLTGACYSLEALTEKPRLSGRGFGARVSRGGQWAQPPALAGDPSVLNDEPQAQLLTAFGLLIAKPEPMSEST